MAATSLSAFVATAVAHEDTPAPIDRRLRVGGFVGIALLALFAAFLWVGWSYLRLDGSSSSVGLWFGSGIVEGCFTLGGHAEIVFRVVVAALLLACLLAIATKGFKEARMAAQFGVYGVHVAGYVAAVPMVVAIFTVLLVVATIIAIVIGIGILLCIIIATALEV